MTRHAVHDPDYRAAQKDWATFVESITQKIIEVDETIPELPVKDVVSQHVTLLCDIPPYHGVIFYALRVETF